MDIQLAKLEQRVETLENEHKEFKKALDPIRERSIRLDDHYKEIMTTLNELKLDIKELKESPRVFLNHIITAIISAVVAFMVAQLPTIILGLQHTGG